MTWVSAAATRSGAVGVIAGDRTCDTRTPRSRASGPLTFSVKNSGSQSTEVYVYGSGDRVMGELENIGHGQGHRGHAATGSRPGCSPSRAIASLA